MIKLTRFDKQQDNKTVWINPKHIVALEYYPNEYGKPRTYIVLDTDKSYVVVESEEEILKLMGT